MNENQRKIVEDYIAEYGFCTDIRTDHEALYKLIDDAKSFIVDCNHHCENKDENKDKLERYVNRLDATDTEKDLIYDCSYLFAKL